MFLQSYQKEYTRICNIVGSCQEQEYPDRTEYWLQLCMVYKLPIGGPDIPSQPPTLAQLEHEVRKTRPYGAMQRLMFMKTITWLIWDKGPDV